MQRPLISLGATANGASLLIIAQAFTCNKNCYIWHCVWHLSYMFKGTTIKQGNLLIICRKSEAAVNQSLWIHNSQTCGLLTVFWQSQLLGRETYKEDVSLQVWVMSRGLKINSPQLFYLDVTRKNSSRFSISLSERNVTLYLIFAHNTFILCWFSSIICAPTMLNVFCRPN